LLNVQLFQQSTINIQQSFLKMKPPSFSIWIFLMLLSIFAASLAMFMALVRRWTTQRQWVSLTQWARQRRLSRRAPGNDEFITALKTLLNGEVEVLLRLSSSSVTLMQIQTAPPPGMQMPSRWNVLMQKRVRSQPAAAGLRPANAPASLIDWFGLSTFPSLTIGSRFTVLATSSSGARALSESASRTLLPADVGLLLADHWQILDFSSRPFDPIELDRVLALADQLNLML
jgi:hypothetical protein